MLVRSRCGLWLLAAAAFLTIAALFLRLWQLNEVPPALWWDEATQGLDAAEILRGQLRVFYPSALGKEPLYIYLTAPFVAAAYGAPWTVRVAGALLSALTVPVLVATGRAMFFEHPYAGTWAGLLAGLFWATNFWAQSIGRIGFQVNALPLVLTAAVLSWLNYTRRPSRQRAILFGVLAGLTLYTYLAARFTPVLWLALFLLLPRSARQALLPTLKLAVLALILVALPLGIHFAFHPADFFSRIGTFSVAQGAVAPTPPDSILWSARISLEAFLGLAGDPVPRHNIPYEPSFTIVAAGLFGLGLITAVIAAARLRHQGAITVLLWWLILVIPATLSRSSLPHYPRLLAALPAAVLIAALPLGLTALAWNRSPRRSLAPVLVPLLAALMLFEGLHTAQAYFVRWARGTDLYGSYQQDLWTFAKRVQSTPRAVGVVALHEGYGKQLDYAFRDVSVFQLSSAEVDVAAWLQRNLGSLGGTEAISVAWGEGANSDADPRRLLQYYLQREGDLVSREQLRGYELVSYRLGLRPNFTARGQVVEPDTRFGSDVVLLAARWGASYPNPDRSAGSAVAGSKFWVTLRWQMGQVRPDLRAAVDILDSANRRISSAEAPLLDARAPSRPWRPGDTVQTYHLVDIPPTQPPGPLTLGVRLYDSANLAPVLISSSGASSAPTPRDRVSLPIARADVLQSRQPPSPAPVVPFDHSFSDGLTLLGADEWRSPVRPGDTLGLRLYWRLQQPVDSRSFTVAVAPELGGQPLSAGTLQLPDGLAIPAVIHSDIDVPLSPNLSPGRYRLLLQDSGRVQFDLGALEIAGRRRNWDLPPGAELLAGGFGSAVALAGMVAPPQIVAAPGDVVTVTLAWRVESPPGTDLIRFAHALGPDGRPAFQRVGAPCAGWAGAGPDDSCPSGSWLVGEILVDTIAFDVPRDIVPARYPLAAGWYDAVTFERLPVRDSVGGEPSERLLRLPVEIIVRAHK